MDKRAPFPPGFHPLLSLPFVVFFPTAPKPSLIQSLHWMADLGRFVFRRLQDQLPAQLGC